MTKKQQDIISAAIELFSKDGFHATSTSKIAKHAGVSEGLIFRHFKTKDGLIQTISTLNQAQLTPFFNSILAEEDAKQIIKKTLEHAFKMDSIELDHWRLHYKLKWEMNQNSLKLMAPLEVILTKAFTQLKYKRPQLESELVVHLVESFIESMVRNEIQNEKLMKEFLIQKYHLN